MRPKSQHAQIAALQHSADHNLQRLGNTLAHLEIHFNQLSTDLADAGVEEVKLPPELEFVLGRFRVQVGQIHDASRMSLGLEPLEPHISTRKRGSQNSERRGEIYGNGNT